MTVNDKTREPIHVHFVCLGNICRSPLAEGVFRHLVEERGLEEHFEISSSGTGQWHIGEQADTRMRETAQKYGLSIERHRASQFAADEAKDYDHILVMDRSNHNNVLHLDQSGIWGDRVELFRAFDPEPGDMEVPDPYYGGVRGFDKVYDIVRRTAEAFLEELIEEHDLEELAQE